MPEHVASCGQDAQERSILWCDWSVSERDVDVPLHRQLTTSLLHFRIFLFGSGANRRRGPFFRLNSSSQVILFGGRQNHQTEPCDWQFDTWDESDHQSSVLLLVSNQVDVLTVCPSRPSRPSPGTARADRTMTHDDPSYMTHPILNGTVPRQLSRTTLRHFSRVLISFTRFQLYSVLLGFILSAKRSHG